MISLINSKQNNPYLHIIIHIRTDGMSIVNNRLLEHKHVRDLFCKGCSRVLIL